MKGIYIFFVAREDQKVGQLGVHILNQEEVLGERLWEHLYNGQDGWQYGEATIKHEQNFSVCIFIALYIGDNVTASEAFSD